LSRVLVLALGLALSSGAWAAPTVTGFAPTNGLPGTQVTVSGSGFGAVARVIFNQTPADFQVASANVLVATVPQGAEVGPIVVVDSSAGSSGTRYFLPEPRLTGFFPTRGATNSTVDLYGANFAAVQAVRFGNQPASYLVTAVNRIRVTVPAGVTNAVPIKVTTATGTATAIEPFRILGPGPVVDSFAPAFGAPGATVEIEGANFAGITAVQFGGVGAVFNSPSPGRILATVPAAAVSGPVAVVTGAGTALSSDNFTVTWAPVIKDFYPRVGQPGQTQVTIEGVNFVGLVGVGFNGRSITTQPVPPSPGRLLVTVPAGATTGPISVTNTAGVGLSTADFVIPIGPMIESFEPTAGRPGDQVRIWGYNLSGTLRFNETVAHYIPSTQAPESILAWVPSGATTGPLSLTNAQGGFATDSVFSVVGDAPHVSGVEPDHAPRGTQVTILGRNFVNPVAVRFNDVPDPTAFAVAPEAILATVPAAATTGPLVVSTSVGSATNATPFHLPPRIASVQPAEAPVGATVALAGANLAHATSVDFADHPAEFTVVTGDGSLQAIVPANAVPGRIRVVTPGGVVLSAAPFNVPPGITSFDPALGPTGTPVTILGTSLQDTSTVRFGGRSAVFEVVSNTELRAVVPTTATSGRIQVITPSGTATSTVDFRVTTSTDLRLIGTSSSNVLAPGELLTFSYTVTNRGIGPATTVILQERLPALIEHVDAEASQGSWDATPGGVTFRLNVLTNGYSATFTTRARALAEGVGTNTVTVTLAEGDQNVGDNTLRLGLAILDPASLRLGLDRAPEPGAVVIQWPVSAMPIVLQSVQDLSLGTGWTPVSGTPVTAEGMRYLTNTTTGPSRYYRLHLDF
jgi:large repetitive protein